MNDFSCCILNGGITISLITVNQHIVLVKLLISSVKILVVYNSDQDLHQGSEGMVNSLKYLIFPKVGSLQSTKYVPGKPANDMLIGNLYSAIPGRHHVIIAHAKNSYYQKSCISRASDPRFEI